MPNISPRALNIYTVTGDSPIYFINLDVTLGNSKENHVFWVLFSQCAECETRGESWALLTSEHLELSSLLQRMGPFTRQEDSIQER